MYSGAPTQSEIRTAQANAVGGERKRCSKGKNCSAACINSGMVCLVELPESAGIAVEKLRDYLMGARDKLIGIQTPSGRHNTPGEFQPLRTPKEAADWLIKHKDEIAMWGIDENRANAIIKHKPKYITVGIEPGGGTEGAEKLQQLVPDLQKLPEVRDAGNRSIFNTKGTQVRNSIMDDELQKANSYKMAMELSNILSSQNPEVFGRGYNMVLTDLLKKGFNVDEWLEELDKSGAVQNGIVRDIQTKYQVPKGGGSWGRGNKILAESAGVGKSGDFMGLLNPSGAWKPMADYSQFNELFKQAGYSKEQAGPFASQREWLRYSANAVKDRFHQILTQAKPEFMYLANAGRDNEALVNIIKTEAQGGRGTFTVSTVSKANKPVERKLEYFLYNHPDGTRTVMIAGPHPSTLAFGSQEALVKATGEIAKSLRERGELPSSVSDLKVSVRRIEEPGDRIRREPPVTKKTTTETSSPVKPQQTGQLVQQLVNLPNGQFGSGQVWRAVEEYQAGKSKKKEWEEKLRIIRKEIESEKGGAIVKGPKADEYRRRVQEAGLLPKSEPSKAPDAEPASSKEKLIALQKEMFGNNNFSEAISVRNVHQLRPSIRRELQPRSVLRCQPTRLG